MDNIKVTAAPRLRVPTEENPRKYITDADQVSIELSVYYQRRLSDGDLVRVSQAEKPAAKVKGA